MHFKYLNEALLLTENMKFVTGQCTRTFWSQFRLHSGREAGLLDAALLQSDSLEVFNLMMSKLLL